MAWTQSKIDEVYEQIKTLAIIDESFRLELLKNPGKAIEKVSGEAVPENYSIRVIENHPEYSFILQPLESVELSGEELDSIAGGACPAYEACGAYVVK